MRFIGITGDIQGGSQPVVCSLNRDGSATKAIARRLHRLEGQFGSPGETEYDVCLRQRQEAARRRIAEARERRELPAEEGRPLTEFDQRRLEILKQAAWHAKLRADKQAKM